MEVQVLGYWGTYPEAGEATTGFLVDTGEQKVLLDCGSGVLSQLFKVCQVPDLDAVVITHHHHDHVADLGVFSYALLLARQGQTRRQPLPVYMPKWDSPAVEDLQNEPLADVHFLDKSSSLQLGGTTVTFVETSHPVYCLAPKFEQSGKTFVFSADSSWNEDLLSHAEGADLFICEASMYEGMDIQARNAGHLTSEQAGRMAAQATVKELAITHYPHFGDVAMLVQEASQAFGQPVRKLKTLQVLAV